MNFRTLMLGVALCGLTTAPTLFSSHIAYAQGEAATTKPFLHSLFTDNAVLQRDRVIPVWGWTTPGQLVTVKLDDKIVVGKADANGKWTAKIGPYPAGGSHTLTIVSTNQPAAITRSNITFGDVWICSGQSNMEMAINDVTDGQKEIAAANYPNIRLYTVPKKTALAPVSDVNSKWEVCTPTNIDRFSAVAYFFGRKVNQETGVPIGLIHTSWGGTNAESWVSASSLGTLPDFKTEMAKVEDAAKNRSTPYDQRLESWLAKQTFTGVTDGSKVGLDDSKWSNINTPGNWDASGVQSLRGFDGIAWYRRTIEIPENLAGQDLTFQATVIDDIDTTYWNGAAIGSTNGWADRRNYKIPGAQVKAGKNVIAIRVTDTGGEGGVGGNASDFKLVSATGQSIPLAGTWKIHTSLSNEQMASAPLQYDPNYPHIVNVLYNAMIAPIESYGVKGALWYQGESNASRPEQYTRLLPVLIKDWRARFNTTLPFYIVQLAGFMAPDEAPKNDDWPRLRAAQAKTVASLPNTGLAVIYDIGEEKDIHPHNKQDVGLRLALNALAKDYGKKVEFSGPSLKSTKSNGARVVLAFDHVDGGLSFKGDTSRLFAVAGADLNWFWASPEIQGSNVVLSSPFVTNPVHVRYAWSNLPEGGLYNGASLPAAPFDSSQTK